MEGNAGRNERKTSITFDWSVRNPAIESIRVIGRSMSLRHMKIAQIVHHILLDSLDPHRWTVELYWLVESLQFKTPQLNLLTWMANNVTTSSGKCWQTPQSIYHILLDSLDPHRWTVELYWLVESLQFKTPQLNLLIWMANNFTTSSGKCW